MMSPSQGLSDEHGLLEADDEVAPSVRAGEASGGMHTEAIERFVTSVTAGEVRFAFST